MCGVLTTALSEVLVRVRDNNVPGDPGHVLVTSHLRSETPRPHSVPSRPTLERQKFVPDADAFPGGSRATLPVSGVDQMRESARHKLPLLAAHKQMFVRSETA
jgi:hypothetical protein